jgi:lipoate-protein ligase A
MVGDAKISGSASMVRRGRVLFHGTLLFDSDLEMLDAALRGDTTLQHKGVKSVHSKVCNLKPLLNIPDMPQFISEITAALTEYYSQ